MVDRLNLVRNNRALLLIGSCVYLALIFGFMLWRGIDIEPQWVVLALLVIALAMGRGKQYIRDWSPFLVLFFAYEAMRGFADDAARREGFHLHSVSRLESFVFGGHIPTIDMQKAWYNAHVIQPLDVITTGVYFMHFVTPLLVGFLFWSTSREHYWRYVSALLLMSYVAFVTYLFAPSAPPWYQFPGQVHTIVGDTLRKSDISYFISPIYMHMNPNQFAAFPSLHAAYPALATMFAWHRHRRIAYVLLAWTAAVWFSIVYLGEHYFVDALAGLVYAIAATVVVTYAANWLVERRRRHEEEEQQRAATAADGRELTPARPSS